MREIRLNGFYIGAAITGFVVLALLTRVLLTSLAAEPAPLAADLGFGESRAGLLVSGAPQPRMSGVWGAGTRSPTGRRSQGRVRLGEDVSRPPTREEAYSAKPPPPPSAAASVPSAPTPTTEKESPSLERVPQPPLVASARLRADADPALPRDGSEEFAPR